MLVSFELDFSSFVVVFCALLLLRGTLENPLGIALVIG